MELLMITKSFINCVAGEDNFGRVKLLWEIGVTGDDSNNPFAPPERKKNSYLHLNIMK